MSGHFNHREEGEFGDGCTMIRIPKRRGWTILGYAILAGAALALVVWAVVNLTP